MIGRNCRRVRKRPDGSLSLAALLVLGLAFVGVQSSRAHGFGHGNGAQLNQPSATYESVETVHVVFTDHLDVGWKNFSIEVVNEYFEIFIPRAISTYWAIDGQKEVYPGGYKYSAHPWILSLYMDCPQDIVPSLRCPSENARNRLKEVVDKDGIVWDRNPFDYYVELLDPSLFEYALSISDELQHVFKKSSDAPVKTLAQIDAPSATRGMIPLMLKAGAEAIYFGWNGGVVAPAVPTTPSLFVWQNGAATDESVLAIMHAGGFGSYTLPSCVVAPGIKDALCTFFAFAPDGTQENGGPPEPRAVHDVYETLSLIFPNASAKASTYDSFIESVLKVKDSLPVVDQEIGDTWVYGAPGDPLKIARFRAYSRARAECIDSGICEVDDPAIRNFSRFLLKIAEHAQGLNATNFLGFFPTQWANPWFELMRKAWNVQALEKSWDEQRLFLDWALEALKEGKSDGAIYLYKKLLKQSGWNQARSDAHGLGAEAERPDGDRYTCGDFEIGFNTTVGFINYLSFEGVVWAESGEVDAELNSSSNLEPRPEQFETPPPISAMPSSETLENELQREQFYLMNRYFQKDQRSAGRRGGLSVEDHPLALFLYQTYSVADYDHFLRGYAFSQPPVSWLSGAFDKPGLETANPQHRFWLPELVDFVKKEDDSTCHFLLTLAMKDNPEVSAQYGAPRKILLEVELPKAGDRIALNLTWEMKDPTRLPEALWLLFKPKSEDPERWRLNKLGQWISPLDVLVNGNRHLHAVQEGVAYCDAEERSLILETLDAAIVSLPTWYAPIGGAQPFFTPTCSGDPGGRVPDCCLKDATDGCEIPCKNILSSDCMVCRQCPTTVNILDFNNSQPVVKDGIYFSLMNNLWGNNFPQWYPWQESDSSMRYRFVLKVGSSCPYES